MTGTWRTLVARVLVASALCTTLIAQTQSKGSPDAEKTYERLPGLDKQLIDTSSSPCTDFAKYACGNFSKLYPIPPDRSGFGPGAMVVEYNQRVLHTMLERAAAGGSDRTPNEQQIGDYYASCMDENAIDRKGLTPLQPELDRIAALKSKDELTPLLAHYQLIGVNAFFNYGEQQDFKDARKQIAALDQGGLGLPERDYYFRTGEAAEKTRNEYVQHITNVLKLMGEAESQAASNARAIMQFETALAKVSMDITSQRDPKNVYHLMPASDVAGLTPDVSWIQFFKDTGTPPITEINVANPDFFKGLNALLSSTSLPVVQTYLRWQVINSTPSEVLPKVFDDEHFDFYGRKLRGQPEQRARWKRCVQATDAALGEALGQVYVAQEFPPSSKQATLQMVHDIETAMDQDIDTLDWMSPATKVRAKEKLHAVADKIGYPDHWRNYSKLVILRGDAYGNAMRAIEFENERELAKIGKPVDRGEFGMTPPTVNAYYSSSMNDINFPAGILQPPFLIPTQTMRKITATSGQLWGMNSLTALTTKDASLTRTETSPIGGQPRTPRGSSKKPTVR